MEHMTPENIEIVSKVIGAFVLVILITVLLSNIIINKAIKSKKRRGE